GAGILATNAVAIATRLRRYRAELAGWQTTLDGLAVEGEEAEGAIEQLTERLARIAAALQESGVPPRD
ncbi:MAG: hypothetical protein ACXVAP_08710, partial [Candidatus Limnocylindrales bacterium]